jgi:hypothetical protein
MNAYHYSNLSEDPMHILLLIALAAPALAFAKPTDPAAPAHEALRLESSVMGKMRRINVYVPPQYDTCSSQQFPVLYMPDGGLARRLSAPCDDGERADPSWRDPPADPRGR